MKQTHIYNELVRFYNRSRRKLHTLAVEGKNLRKQSILQRRIVRLFKILTGMHGAFKQGITTAALSAGMLLFQPNAAHSQIAFGASQINPFGLDPHAIYITPSFADLDGDGDMDIMSGGKLGHFAYYQDIGTAAAPAFAAVTEDTFGLEYYYPWTAPSFADLDADGDMDMILGNGGSDFQYYQNTGSTAAPHFDTPQTNPFGLTNVPRFSTPVFIDLDGDGDMDLMAGEYYGKFKYFKNTGTPTAPAFAAVKNNPFGLTDIGFSSAPAFADLDEDGDMDLMSGESSGRFFYFQNVGTAAAPSFIAPLTNAFGLMDVGTYSTPAFADLDGDGDMDLMAGGRADYYNSNFYYFENTTPESASCAIPSNLLATNITSSSAKLKWDAVAEAEGYTVRYKVSNTDGWKYGTTYNSSKPISGLLPNTAYKWEVRTFCQVAPDVISEWSPRQKFTTGSLRMSEGTPMEEDESLQQISFQIYPNPAEDHAAIQYTLPQAAHVYIKVYDVSGKEIAALLEDDLEQGEHSLLLNTLSFPKGVYLVKMISEFGIENQKLIVQ